MFVLTAISLFSCKKDENQDLSTSQRNIETYMKAGLWRVSKMTNNSVSQTAKFADYQFNFSEENKVTAGNGSSFYQGTWGISDNDPNVDSEADLEVTISFTTPTDFEKISKSWTFVSTTISEIQLVHESNISGQTDYLTFKKIN